MFASNGCVLALTSTPNPMLTHKPHPAHAAIRVCVRACAVRTRFELAHACVATHNGMLLLLDDDTVAASHKTMAEASEACALVHKEHSRHIYMNFYEVLQFACQVPNDSCFKRNNF